MGQYEEKTLNKKELAWKKDALELGEGLIEKYSGKEIATLTISLLDDAFENAMQTTWWKRPRKFMIATGLGYALGQYLVDQLGFEWIAYKDYQGKDIAVKHQASGIISFPISAIRKRLKTKEYRFMEDYVQVLKKELTMIKKEIPRLHYVSQSKVGLTHLEAIKEACQAGCKWVQLRMKEVTFQEYLDTAMAAKTICQNYQVKLTINDNAAVAKAVQADGLHLGKEDMSPLEARKIVGDIIIGGTANTWEDVQRLSKEQVDYIGLGPFRYTTTKKKISPVLGIDGYTRIIDQMKAQEIDIPVLAIGGINPSDIKAILSTGVWGIAASGLITNAKDKQKTCTEIMQQLKD
ncbi:thiamine phosphate synthase [Aureispira anguillae]|uniref:Thiamine-phosphate synthase n=1 Tax=Aureispira anguillae TaxID=2864201 RepID=A0A916DTI4_9BACT|nr:thiamine phosphate synthase [Aureispira anguillae]BDS11817.1 thiamine phosphate synthase [Aureispira anguillae]